VNEAVFGLSTSESLAYYDQNTSSWKTSQLSLDGESTEFSGTWPRSGMVRSGKLFMRPTLGCLIVENESALLPTPTRSFGVNARGWGLSQTGRLRYSEQVEKNALQFGYRPPITLLEWMMGFPENYTDLGPRPLETLSCQQPSSGLVGSSSNTISSLGVIITRNSLAIGKELSYEEWESIGYELFKVNAAWQWWVGDWINYGEKKYGKTYEQALALTEKNKTTLEIAACVAREFEIFRRRNLSFSHHQDVAGLDREQQDAILDQAEREGKPRSWVREKVKELKGLPEPKPDIETTSDEAKDPDEVIEAFQKVENRIELLKKIIETLTQTERVLLREFLREPSSNPE